jgi:hypothetical protein
MFIRTRVTVTLYVYIACIVVVQLGRFRIRIVHARWSLFRRSYHFYPITFMKEPALHTRLRADDRGIVVRCQVGTRFVSSPKRQFWFATHPLSWSVDTGCKGTGTWSWPLIFIERRDREWVELCLHSPLCLRVMHGTASPLLTLLRCLYTSGSQTFSNMRTPS